MTNTREDQNAKLAQVGANLSSPYYHQKIAGIIGEKNMEKFKSYASLILLQNPKMLEADARLLTLGLIKISQFELMPNQDEAYLIAYGNNVSMQIGYKGYIKLAARAGLTVRAEIVYVGEQFDVEYVLKYGEHEKDTWLDIANFKPIDNGKFDIEQVKKYIKSVYVVLDDEVTGKREVRALRITEMLKRMQTSQTFTRGGFYDKWFEEMLKKTMIKYVLKNKVAEKDDERMDRVAQALRVENNAENNKPQTTVQEVKNLSDEEKGEIIEAHIIEGENVDAADIAENAKKQVELNTKLAELNSIVEKIATENKQKPREIMQVILQKYEAEYATDLTIEQVNAEIEGFAEVVIK